MFLFAILNSCGGRLVEMVAIFALIRRSGWILFRRAKLFNATVDCVLYDNPLFIRYDTIVCI